MNREPGFLRQQHIQPADESAAARHYNTALDDVRRKLGWSDFQRTSDCADDLLNRLLHRVPDFRRVDPHALRDSRYEIAALHFHLPFLADRIRRPDLDLYLLRGRFADEKVVI